MELNTFVCIIAPTIILVLSAGMWLIHRAMCSSERTVTTLDQLLRITQDRVLNTSDTHLEAKRIEMANHEAQRPMSRPRAIMPVDPMAGLNGVANFTPEEIGDR